jgi:hypothetical protein
MVLTGSVRFIYVCVGFMFLLTGTSVGIQASTSTGFFRLLGCFFSPIQPLLEREVVVVADVD